MHKRRGGHICRQWTGDSTCQACLFSWAVWLTGHAPRVSLLIASIRSVCYALHLVPGCGKFLCQPLLLLKWLFHDQCTQSGIL